MSDRSKLIQNLTPRVAKSAENLVLGLFAFMALLSLLMWFGVKLPPLLKWYGVQVYLVLVLGWVFIKRGWRPILKISLRSLLLSLTLLTGYFVVLWILDRAAAGDSEPLVSRHTPSITEILVNLAMAPIFEELFFRDLVFRSVLLRARTYWLTILITSIIFMFAHLSLYSGAFVLSVVACVLVIWTGSIIPAIVFHFVSNASLYFLPVWFPSLFDLLHERGWTHFFYR